tara:strand:+ start:1134 stop:1841 length:708 start_codon:yes stop_codon:yes gene_type:complete
MKILISGGDSKFSKELQKQNQDHRLIPLNSQEMNVLHPKDIENAIKTFKPDVFLHSAALSRPMDVHKKYPEKSITTNIIGTANCVLACIKYNIKFVYISTDFVYEGITGNYKETDPVKPINEYAWSKLGGECSVMLYPNSLILRTAMVEKPFPHEKAFTDIYKSSIWYSDAAKKTLELIEKKAVGVYNLGGERKSIFNFVKQEKNNILPLLKEQVKEITHTDISLNIDKLNDTTI